MKSIKVLFCTAALASMALLHCVAADDVRGGRLNIGVNNVLLGTNIWNTIAGGADNTNHSIEAAIGGGAYNTVYTNSQLAVISGGELNEIFPDSPHSVISGGKRNIIANDAEGSVIAGGSGNIIHLDAYGSSISGGVMCFIGTNSPYSWIGGGSWNEVRNDADYTVIGGGYSNVVSVAADYSSILGGHFNRVEGAYDAIAGGYTNVIQSNSRACFIGSGMANLIEPNAERCSIVGGNGNSIEQDAFGATVVNGWFNTAGGTNSLAAGSFAKAIHNGSFVWGDYTGSYIASTAANQFIVRAGGGIWLGTNSSVSIGANRFIDTASGGNLTHGGQWSNNSDRNSKENFKPVSGKQVLEKLVALPVTTWNYKTEGTEIEHIGPVAQDFQAAFSYGGDEKSISTSDASGVAFAAIQGLYEMLREKDTQLKEMQKELKAIREGMAK